MIAQRRRIVALIRESCTRPSASRLADAAGDRQCYNSLSTRFRVLASGLDLHRPGRPQTRNLADCRRRIAICRASVVTLRAIWSRRSHRLGDNVPAGGSGFRNRRAYGPLVVVVHAAGSAFPKPSGCLRGAGGCRLSRLIRPASASRGRGGWRGGLCETATRPGCCYRPLEGARGAVK
jgi:hypothetical protein